MQGLCKRFATACLSLGILMMCAAGLLLHASAAGTTGNLTLICQKEDQILSGMQFSVYRVGSRSDDGKSFVFDGDFANYRVTLGDWSAEAFAEAAATLENYAVLDNIPPLLTGTTDTRGVIRFEGLENGLYMAMGKKMKIGDLTYFPAPILFEMDGSQESELNGYPKYIVRTLADESGRYALKKVWANVDDTTRQPESVGIEIYRDGKLFDTVILSADNNWTYYWDVEIAADWRVKEPDVPDDYSVIYRSNGQQFVVVNTLEEHDVTTSSTTNTTTTTTETTTLGNNQVSNTIPSDLVENTDSTVTTTTTKPPQVTTSPTTSRSQAITSEVKLPQTGQLWWPVPILIFGGMILIGIGFRINCDNESEDRE